MIIDANTHGFHGRYFGPLLKLGGKWAKQVVDADIEYARPRPQLHDPELRRSLGLSQKDTDALFADNIRRALKLA